jgi:hypothetical protein
VARRLGVPLTAADGALGTLGTLGLVVAIAGLGLLVRSVRARRWAAAVAALSLCEAGLFHGVIATAAIATAERSSPKPLIARVLRDLPDGATVTVSGLGYDSSLLVLLYFPDPALIVVIPSRARLPTSFPPGYYLFGRARWSKITRTPAGSRGAWRVLWEDQLGERKEPAPVVFVEHQS